MKIYFMYKFSDKEEAVKKIEELRGKGLDVFAFDADVKYHGSLWKISARKKIKECNYVCYFFRYSSYFNDGTQKNVLWEYKTAQKYGKKVIFIDGGDDNKAISNLLDDEKRHLLGKLFNEKFSEKDVEVKLSSFGETQEKLGGDLTWKASDVVVQNGPIEKGLDQSGFYNILFEQYKLMVETSESLINRRQTTSNVYVGILTALISLVGSSLALSNKYVTGIIFMIVGLITITLSMNWKAMLTHYDKNNEGKFEVINAIEARLPANMFDTEYKYNKIKSIVSYASREKNLCRIFTIIGAVLTFAGLALTVLSFVLGL